MLLSKIDNMHIFRTQTLLIPIGHKTADNYFYLITLAFLTPLRSCKHHLTPHFILTSPTMPLIKFDTIRHIDKRNELKSNDLFGIMFYFFIKFAPLFT